MNFINVQVQDSIIYFLLSVCISTYSFSLYADCRLCPEITPVKILLKNGVIRKGHIETSPEEELSTKPERGLEVIRRLEKLRLFLSLESITGLDHQLPHVLYDKVYMDIPYKDIAKIELLKKIDK